MGLEDRKTQDLSCLLLGPREAQGSSGVCRCALLVSVPLGSGPPLFLKGACFLTGRFLLGDPPSVPFLSSSSKAHWYAGLHLSLSSFPHSALWGPAC